MARITLRKALNRKNKLTGRIKELESLIANNFSRTTQIVNGKELESNMMDVSNDIQVLNDCREKLVQLKTKLAEANVAIYSKIYRIAELKAEITWLRGLQMRKGETVNSYDESNIITRTNPIWTMEQVLAKIKYAEGLIEEFQDQIDEYNGSTFIEVAD